MFKFMVTGDNHLRYMQYSRTLRGSDFFEAFIAMARLAIEMKVDAILNTGDIFNGSVLTSQVFGQLKIIDKLLQEAGIPMYTLSGNHEMADPPWTSHFGDADKPGGIKGMDNVRLLLERDGKELVIQGLPFMAADAMRDALADMECCDILMWHGAVREFCGFPTETAISETEFPEDKIGCAMLGDIHVHELHTMPKGTVIGYPGSTELCDKKEDPIKKAWILDIEPGVKPVKCTSAVLKTRPVVQLEVRNDDDMEAVLATVQAAGELPLVFVKYSRSLPDAQNRLRTILGPDVCMLRAMPLPQMNTDRMDAGKGIEELRVRDLVPDFIPKGTDEYELALLLADRNAENPEDSIDAYVDAQLAKGG